MYLTCLLFSNFPESNSLACGILVPWPGIKPMTPAVEARSLNHWTIRKFPPCICVLLILVHSLFLHVIQLIWPVHTHTHTHTHTYYEKELNSGMWKETWGLWDRAARHWQRHPTNVKKQSHVALWLPLASLSPQGADSVTSLDPEPGTLRTPAISSSCSLCDLHSFSLHPPKAPS